MNDVGMTEIESVTGCETIAGFGHGQRHDARRRLADQIDGLRCVDAGVNLFEQRADHACAPRIAIEFPQRIQAVLMPQDPAEYAILCTQADADAADRKSTRLNSSN